MSTSGFTFLLFFVNYSSISLYFYILARIAIVQINITPTLNTIITFLPVYPLLLPYLFYQRMRHRQWLLSLTTVKIFPYFPSSISDCRTGKIETGIYLPWLSLFSLILRNIQGPITNTGNSILRHKKPCGLKLMFASKSKPITHAANVDIVATIYIKTPLFQIWI